MAAASAAAVLAVSLAACGGDDDSATAQDAGAPAAGGEPGAEVPGGLSPGTGDDAYDPGDQYANPGAACGDKEPANTITMSGLAFCSDTYTGKAGSQWTAVNKEPIKHNVASDDTAKPKPPAKFKSADLDAEGEVKFKVPTKKGKYTIICDYHPGSMTATLTLS